MKFEELTCNTRVLLIHVLVLHNRLSLLLQFHIIQKTVNYKLPKHVIRVGYQSQATHSVIGEMMKARFGGSGAGPPWRNKTGHAR